jgi:hypothetical protein
MNELVHREAEEEDANQSCEVSNKGEQPRVLKVIEQGAQETYLGTEAQHSCTGLLPLQLKAGGQEHWAFLITPAAPTTIPFPQPAPYPTRQQTLPPATLLVGA